MRRISLLIALGAILTFVLVACGGGGAPPTSLPVPTQPSAVTQPPAAEGYQGGAVSNGGTISGKTTYSGAAMAPEWFTIAPAHAAKALLDKVGWSKDHVDLIEINEAFSVQLVAVLGQLEVDPARVNVNGGAVALGHPIGASGARILTTLLYALENRGLRRGVAALCLGGGNGVSLAVERF